MNSYIYVGLSEQDQLLSKFGILKSDPNYIIDKVCQALELTIDELRSPIRKREYVEARFIAVGLAFKVNRKLTLKKMGSLLGGRDHSTIIYAQRMYDDLSLTNFEFKEKIIAVKSIC